MKLYILLIGILMLSLLYGCNNQGTTVNQRFDMDSENQRLISNQAERQLIVYDYGETIRTDENRIDTDSLTIERRNVPKVKQIAGTE